MRRTLAAMVFGLALGGCSSSDEPQIADYLDELEFSAPTKSVAYVSVGHYSVPIPQRPGPTSRQTAAIPASDESSVDDQWRPDPYRLHVRFELAAESAPEFESDLVSAMERHRGLIDDAVLTTCRSITPDELADPRLAALKSRLSDELRPLLGERRVRQFVVNDYVEERF